MKTAKRMIAALLAASLIATLAGCGLFDTKMARAVQKMSKLESLHVDLSAAVVLDLTVTHPAQSEDTDAENAEETETAGETERDEEPTATGITLQGTARCGIDWLTDPLLARAELELTLPGSTDHYLAYLDKEESAYYLYSVLNGGTIWQKSGFAENDGEKVKGLKYIIQGAESFEQTGTEVLNGVQTTRYDGLLSGEYLEGLIRLYKIYQLLTDGFGMQLEADVFENMGDVPASLWLDDSAGMIVRLDVDLTEAAERIGDKQMRRLREATGIRELGLDLSLNRVVVSAELSQFDKIESFTIPDEAKAAWGDSVKKPWES